MAAIAAVVVTLAACAPEPQESASPSPRPSATAAPEPTPTGPVAAFGGDCSAAVDTAAVTAAMGEAMSFWEPAWEDGADAELGGLRCGWTSDQYLSGFATVWVYPVAVLDPTYVSGEESNSCQTADPICMASEVFGGTWVGVQAYSNTAATQIERLRPLLADIGDRVAESAPPVPGPRQGWWLPVATCEELAASLTTDGFPSTSTDDRPATGPVFVDGPRSRGCSLNMEIEGEERGVTLLLDAGAGRGVEAVLTRDPSQRIDFEGRTFANAPEQYPLDGNPGLIIGSDGVNLVSVLRSDGDGQAALDAPILAALLKALDG